MADNIDISPGSGKTVSTDERTIAATTVHVQRVNDIGGASVAVGRVSVTVTSGEALAARDTRKEVTFYNLGTATVDVGPSGVASGSGFPLEPGASLTLHTTASIHMDAASGTQSVAYIEVYD